MFELHSKLKQDLLPMKELLISKLMLYPDSENPWIVLVPQVSNIKEFHQLSEEHQQQLLKEINQISEIFEKEFSPDKINIGSLGNMVPQLHIHIICRFKNDKAWPGSIWGSPTSTDKEKLVEIKKKIMQHIQ